MGGTDKQITYDTIWNWSDNKTINNADLREVYINILSSKADGNTPINPLKIDAFPPNHVWEESGVKTGGDLILWSDTIQQDKTTYQTKYKNTTDNKHYQPRYDFSVPTDLSNNPTIFDSCDMSMVVFPYSNFQHCSAKSTTFNGAMLRGSDFSGADLEGADFSFYENNDILTRTDLVRSNFVNANLKDVNFIGANLAYVDFSGAKIQGCKFWGANIAHADFSYADFGTGANFIGAGPFYYVQPGNEILDNEKLEIDDTGKHWTKKIKQSYLNGEYWTMASEDLYEKYEYGVDYTDSKGSIKTAKTAQLKELGYWAQKAGGHLGNPNVGPVNGRLVFSFLNEAKMNPKAPIYDDALYNKDVATLTTGEIKTRAHRDNILMEVMPKFPEGFNTMGALGWERDISGIITPHFRRGAQFYIDAGDQQPKITKTIVDKILANTDFSGAIVEDIDGNPTDYIDISTNDLYGPKNNTIKNLPITRYADQDLANTTIANITSLEHGRGFNNAANEVYLKTQTQLSCNKYETLSHPVQDLSGLVYKKTAGGNAYANFNYVDFTNNSAYTKMHFKHSDLGAEGGDATGITFVGATFPSTIVASDGTPTTVDASRNTVFENCSLNKVDFSGASLIGADFSTTVTIEGAKFHGADLTGADFSGVDLTDVEFTNVEGSQAGLTAAQKAQAGNVVYNAKLTNVNFSHVKNPHAAKWPLGMDISAVVGGELLEVGGTRNRVDNITVAEMIAAGRRVWINHSFKKEDMLDANGNAIDFSGANLSGSVFESAELIVPAARNINAAKNWKEGTGASLNGIDFSGADLTDVVFTGVDLTGAKFTNWTKFNRTVFVDARNPKKAESWPQGFAYDIAVINNKENPDN